MERTSSQTGQELGRRRSRRVLLQIPVVVQGESDGVRFAEETSTLVINAHGALILLRHEVKENQQITLKNASSGEEQPCRVVYQGAFQGGRAQVGIEFVTPAPHFWHISFPPEDWATAAVESGG